MEIKGIHIDYIYFHYIDKSKTLDNLRKGGVWKIAPSAHEEYAKQIVAVVNKPESEKSYDIFEMPAKSKKALKSKVESMRRRPIPQESALLDSDASSLGSRLFTFMPGTAKPGVLFIILFTEGGRRFICFLKLSWITESIGDYDKKTTTLSLKELVEELPVRGHFQKGAIYPHPERPGSSYMKVYQEDAEAHYFEEFLGGMPEVSGSDMMQELRRLGTNMTGQPLTLDENLGLFQGLDVHLGQQRKIVDADDVIRIMGQALPSVNKKDLRDRVKDDIRMTGMIRASQVADLKIVFNVGGIQLTGSFYDVLSNFRTSPARPNEHIIKGAISGVKLGKR